MRYIAKCSMQDLCIRFLFNDADNISYLPVGHVFNFTKLTHKSWNNYPLLVTKLDTNISDTNLEGQVMRTKLLYSDLYLLIIIFKLSMIIKFTCKILLNLTLL